VQQYFFPAGWISARNPGIYSRAQGFWH